MITLLEELINLSSQLKAFVKGRSSSYLIIRIILRLSTNPKL